MYCLLTGYFNDVILFYSLPERGSLGLKFFSANRYQSIRRNMKGNLSSICKELQQEIADLKYKDHEEKENILFADFLPKQLK